MGGQRLTTGERKRAVVTVTEGPVPERGFVFVDRVALSDWREVRAAYDTLEAPERSKSTYRDYRLAVSSGRRRKRRR